MPQAMAIICFLVGGISFYCSNSHQIGTVVELKLTPKILEFAMNIGVRISFQISVLVFLRQVLRSGTAGL